MIVLFWIFIATILIFQLLAVDEYDFPKAFFYCTIITGTFAVYVHLVLSRIVKKYIQHKYFFSLITWILITGIFSSVVLTIEDCVINSFFDQDWNKHMGSMLPQFFGMLIEVLPVCWTAIDQT